MPKTKKFIYSTNSLKLGVLCIYQLPNIKKTGSFIYSYCSSQCVAILSSAFISLSQESSHSSRYYIPTGQYFQQEGREEVQKWDCFLSIVSLLSGRKIPSSAFIAWIWVTWPLPSVESLWQIISLGISTLFLSDIRRYT